MNLYKFKLLNDQGEPLGDIRSNPVFWTNQDGTFVMNPGPGKAVVMQAIISGYPADIEIYEGDVLWQNGEPYEVIAGDSGGFEVMLMTRYAQDIFAETFLDPDMPFKIIGHVLMGQRLGDIVSQIRAETGQI